MTLIVWTARVSYGGRDRLDVTRKTAVAHVRAFAPSWKLLGPMIALRRSGDDELAAWPEYVEGYTAEMRNSYRGNLPVWEWLLGLGEVTLCCYCTDHVHCHRTLLAGFLGKLGAHVRGERLQSPSVVVE